MNKISFLVFFVFIFAGCTLSEDCSSDNSEEETVCADNSTDGFVKYDSSGTAISDCEVTSKAVLIEDISLMVETKTTSTYKQTKNFSEAQSYCNDLTIAGFVDWRLPTVNDLESIVANRSKTDPNGNYYIPYIYENILDTTACNRFAYSDDSALTSLLAWSSESGTDNTAYYKTYYYCNETLLGSKYEVDPIKEIQVICVREN
jgi:hypothetical protein